MKVLNKKVLVKSHHQLGANAVEYGLVLAIIAAMMIAAASFMNKPIEGMFVKVGECVRSLVTGSAGCIGAAQNVSFQDDSVPEDTAHIQPTTATDSDDREDLVNQNIQDTYAADITEMQNLAVENFVHGSLTPQQGRRLQELKDKYDNGTGGLRLLLTGNYNGHFFQQGVGLDLDSAEQQANAFNDNDNHLVIQSIFDPVVSDKPLTIDEYSVVVNLPDNIDPGKLLAEMAADMDGVLGDKFNKAGDFQNQGVTPEVGQIIDIDVKDIPQWWASVPFIDDESPINAPVIITDIADQHFTVQTLELNGNEHPLHGTRQWGYEILEDGSYKFYTRGISVEDDFKAEQGAKAGEYNMWNLWVDGVENYTQENGGSIVDDSRINDQQSGPSANELWNILPAAEQQKIKSTQIQALQREIDYLVSNEANYSDLIRVGELKQEIENWEKIEAG